MSTPATQAVAPAAEAARQSHASDAARRGLICLDSDGAIAFAAGLGRENALQALACDPDWCAEMAEKRMAALTFNGQKLVLIWCPVADGNLVMIARQDGQTVFDFVAAVDFAFDIFEHLLSNPFDGMTVVDARGIVRFISPVHEAFFNFQRGEAIGKPVEKVIENTRLHHVIRTGKPEVGQTQRMRGDNRIVSRTPIFREDRLMGAIGRVMFKSPAQVSELNQRIRSLENEVEFYRREVDAVSRKESGIAQLLGDSPAMQILRRDILRVAALDVPVLLMGESGVGKELVAHALHHLSSRRSHRMVMINAAALPATLVESELFGYAAGAFTGARQQGYAGKFEQADKGSLFLDEVGDMPPDVQAKLLRVLQDGVVEKLGSAAAVQVDFRLITATNRDLEAMVDEGAFRLDLFYRISPVVLRIPPLRQRREDVPVLAAHFLQAFAERHDRPPCRLDAAAAEILQERAWPGNVRQLKHEMERAAIFDSDGVITPEDLPPDRAGRGEAAASDPSPEAEVATMTLTERLERMEDRIIGEAMRRLGGNKKKVAEALGISRSYLYKKLGQLEE